MLSSAKTWNTLDVVSATGVLLATALVGIAVAAGLAWALLLALLVISVAYFARAGVEPVLAGVLIVTPVVVGAQRVPFAGVQVWGVVLALLAAALGYRLMTSWMRGGRFRATAADLAAAVLIVWLFLSFLVAGSPYVDLRLFAQWTTLPFLMYVAGRIVFSGAHPERWSMVAAVGATLAAVELFVEYRWGRPLFATSTYEWAGDAYRAGSMLQGPNFAADYFALSLAAVLPLVSRTNLGRSAAAMVVFLPLTYIGTRSIGGVIAMGTAFAVLLIARGTWLTRALLISVVVLLLSPPVRTTIAEQEFFAAHNQSIATRVDVIQSARIALAYLQRDPFRIVMGGGYGQWEQIGGQFSVGEASDVPGQSLENTYLALLLENGLPAVGLFVTLIIAAVWNGWRRRTDPVPFGGALAAVVLAIAAGTGTLLIIPQVLGLALFLLPSVYVNRPLPTHD